MTPGDAVVLVLVLVACILAAPLLMRYKGRGK